MKTDHFTESQNQIAVIAKAFGTSRLGLLL